MIVYQLELAFVAAIALGGNMLAYAGSLRGCAIPLFGPAFGVTFYVIIGWFLFLSPVQFNSGIVVALTVLAPSLWACLLLIRDKKNRIDVRTNIIWIAIPSLLLVILFWLALPLIEKITYIKHVDSMRYLGIGTMLHNHLLDIGVSLSQIKKRLVALGILHSIANVSGDFYLRSVSPLIALSILLMAAGSIMHGAHRLGKSTALSLIVATSFIAVLSMLSMNRFVMHAFYINGHLLVALCLMMIVIGGWLSSLGDRRIAWTFLQGFGACVLVLTRPEGTILSALALAPTLVSAKIPFSRRFALLLCLGAATCLWQGWVAYLYFKNGRGIDNLPLEVTGLIGAGAAMIALAPVLRLKFLESRPQAWLVFLEVIVWAALAVCILRDFSTFGNSVTATWKNIETYWGYSILLLWAIFAATAIFNNFTNRIFFRLPGTVYLPVMFLLPYLRDGAYRVGGGDSLNRMMISIIPLLVLFIAISAVSRNKVTETGNP